MTDINFGGTVREDFSATPGDLVAGSLANVSSGKLLSYGSAEGWWYLTGSRFLLNGDFDLTYEVRWDTGSSARDIFNFAFWITPTTGPNAANTAGFAYRLQANGLNDGGFLVISPGTHAAVGTMNVPNAVRGVNYRVRLIATGTSVRALVTNIDTGTVHDDRTVDLSSLMTGGRTTSGIIGEKQDGAGTIGFPHRVDFIEVTTPAGGSVATSSATLALTTGSQAGLGQASAAAAGALAISNPSVPVSGTMAATAAGALTITVPARMALQPASAAADAGLMLGVVPAPDFTEGNVWEGWAGTSTELAYDARETFDERWRSGQHVGDARPTMLAAVRTGRFMRSYAPWHGDPTATIGRSPQNRPWQATWTPDSAYDFVPNVLSVRQSKAHESAGIGSATIEIENIAYPLIPGGGHLIRRGFLAPLRGYVAAGRDPLTDEGGAEVIPNGWYRKLAKNSQITLWQGYGNIGKVPFTGLIDDVDTTSRPDRITVTVRDFGQVLSDERVFGWNKDPDIKDPVVFIDRDQADTLTPVYGDATASDSVTGFGPSKVNDSDSNTAWASEAEATPDVTKWIDIELDQQGRYNDYVLWPSFAGMEIYVSVYAKSWTDEDGVEQDPTRDGVPITPDAWVDNGSGLVPGANGGREYIQHVTGLSATKVTRDLDATYVLGEGSRLRVHFRDLGETTAGSGSYRAGAIDLHARRRTLQEAARKERWILVDDVSDIVKVVLRWAGFKEWDVESTGVKLQKRLVIGRDKFYRDVIKICEDAVGYVFFMGDPTNMAASIGVPTFRRPRTVLTDAEIAALGEPVVTVTDELLLTAIKVRETDEPLAYIIRVRGKTSDDGATLGGSSTKRIMYEYRTPWSGTSQDEDGVVTRFGSGDLAGINKPVIYTNNLFRTVDDVKFGALHIALSQALGAITATVEIPAHPGIELDGHVILKDLGTGVTSRLSVTNRESVWRGGEQTSATMTLTGALIDTPNIQAVLEDIHTAVRG